MPFRLLIKKLYKDKAVLAKQFTYTKGYDYKAQQERMQTGYRI